MTETGTTAAASFLRQTGEAARAACHGSRELNAARGFPGRAKMRPSPTSRKRASSAATSCGRVRIRGSPVGEGVAEVARRVRKAGGYSESRFFKAVREACKKARVPRFGPGQYRHTVATRLLNAGADPAAVAAFLGHKSPQTTRRFYATNAVVPVPVPLGGLHSGATAG